MKTIMLAACLALAAAGLAGAQEPEPLTVERVNQNLQDLADQVEKAKADLTALEERLDALEKRLGEPNRFKSSLDTIESRIEDLEKSMDRLER